MPLKIAMIGAGSIGFTRKLMHDILAVPELNDTHFAFMDISQSNLDMVSQLAKRDIEFNELPATVSSTTDRRAAIAVALGSARPGDVVVIAGKGHEQGQEVAGVVTPFDDRLVAAELLASTEGPS